MSIGRLSAIVVLVAGVLAIPAVLLLLAAFYEALLAPPVLVYTNMPFPVEDGVVAPGETVTFIVGRCANDPLAPDPVIYTFTREIVNADTQARTGIPDGSSDVPRGCEAAFRSSLNIIPVGMADGRYFVQGTSTAQGRFKVTVTRWQSQEFEVRRKEAP